MLPYSVLIASITPIQRQYPRPQALPNGSAPCTVERQWPSGLCPTAVVPTPKALSKGSCSHPPIPKARPNSSCLSPHAKALSNSNCPPQALSNGSGHNPPQHSSTQLNVVITALGTDSLLLARFCITLYIWTRVSLTKVHAHNWLYLDAYKVR